MTTTVDSYAGWLGYMAGQMIGHEYRADLGMDSDDLAQIGMIAMWQAEQSFDRSKGSLPAWLTFKAAGAMKATLRERQYHALYRGPRPEDWDAELGDQLAYGDVFEMVQAAYHAGEVSEALSALTPRQREYVKMRFWEQKTTSELTKHFGYDPRGVWAGAKIKLAESLGHLHEAL